MRRALPVLAAALISLALASCSGSEDSAQKATPTTGTSIVTAPAEDPITLLGVPPEEAQDSCS